MYALKFRSSSGPRLRIIAKISAIAPAKSTEIVYLPKFIHCDEVPRQTLVSAIPHS